MCPGGAHSSLAWVFLEKNNYQYQAILNLGGVGFYIFGLRIRSIGPKCMRSTSETRFGIPVPVEPKFLKNVSGGARKSQKTPYFCLKCPDPKSTQNGLKMCGNTSKVPN